MLIIIIDDYLQLLYKHYPYSPYKCLNIFSIKASYNNNNNIHFELLAPDNLFNFTAVLPQVRGFNFADSYNELYCSSFELRCLVRNQ